MLRLRSLFASMLVLLVCASLRGGAEVDPLQAFRRPVSREAVVGALLANPQTKSYLTEATSRRGISAAQISSLAKTPLPRQSAPSPSIAPVAVYRIGDAEFAALNWTTGFTFAPFSVPIYGPQNWKLGVLEVKDARLRSWTTNVLGGGAA